MNEVQTKPKIYIKFNSSDGNIFTILAHAENALKLYNIINAKEKASEMRKRAIKSESYDDALEIIREYVDIIEDWGAIMPDLKIIRLDIVLAKSGKSENKILKSYYLINPDENKLYALRNGVEKWSETSNGCFEGLWEIEDFVNRHFETLNIERTEIKW